MTTNRRAFLGSAAIGSIATSMAGPPTFAARGATSLTTQGIVRDRIWIFTAPEGANNSYLERGGFRGGSRMTPAEAAFYLSVPNLIFVNAGGLPRHPRYDRGWRAKTTFEQYAISFRPLNRVLWSVVGAGGIGGSEMLPEVIRLAKSFPNFEGVFLDDFIRRTKQSDGRTVGRPAMSTSDLRAMREQLQSLKRPQEVWVTLYTRTINPKHEEYMNCEPPLSELLGLFDVLTLWTWNAEELPQLEENMEALEAIAPKQTRKALGLYIYDYRNLRPVPLDLMRHQCELGLRWLKEGRVSQLIFLANTVLDLDFESGEWARKWIAEVGIQHL